MKTTTKRPILCTSRSTSFAPSAEFSDAKVHNVVTQSWATTQLSITDKTHPKVCNSIIAGLIRGLP
jgi:hypothetical protein